MYKRLEEFLGTRGVRHEVLTHREAFTSQEEAARAHVSGWSWAKTLVVTLHPGPRSRAAHAGP